MRVLDFEEFELHGESLLAAETRDICQGLYILTNSPGGLDESCRCGAKSARLSVPPKIDDDVDLDMQLHRLRFVTPFHGIYFPGKLETLQQD